MEPTSTVSLGCRLLAEFDDAAGPYTDLEYVPVPAAPVLPAPAGNGPGSPSWPPSEEAAAAAKKLWLVCRQSSFDG
jgi:hypothetical protein